MGTELRRIWLVPILIANTEGLVCRVWDQNPKDTLVCGYVCKNPLLSTLRAPKLLCLKGLGPPNNQFRMELTCLAGDFLCVALHRYHMALGGAVLELAAERRGH